MLARLTAIAALSFALSVDVLAAPQDELEEWQRRILEAIEDVESEEDGKRGYSREPRRDDGASEAAAKARREHGGEVLAVVPAKGGYKVRLLKRDGRVVTVTVKD